MLLLLTFAHAPHAAEQVEGGSQDGFEQAPDTGSVVDDGDEPGMFGSAPERDPTRSYVPRRKVTPHKALRGERPRPRSSTRAPIENACERFLGPGESVGDLGRIVESAITHSRYKKQFLAGAGIQRYCPRYDSFTTDEQRLKAWVAFWGVVADEESTCGTDPETYASWKSTYGLWQLERDPEMRARNARGPECRSLKTVANEAACALSIMGDTQFRATKHRRSQPVYSLLSYWGTIRRSYDRRHQQVLPKMRRIDFCN